MAKSSNRRKNGKVVKADLRKKVNSSLKHSLKDLLIVSVVDREEVEGKSKPLPRTYVWDVKKNKEVGLTPSQTYAIYNERWMWDVYTGIVCRDFETGKVTLEKEDGFICTSAYKQTDLSFQLADELCDAFEKCDGNALTMVWAMCPVEMSTQIDINIILYGLWKWNMLGNHLTYKEQIEKNAVIKHYRTDNFDEFKEWYEKQEYYIALSKQSKHITVEFIGSGSKAKSGELVKYRNNLQHILTTDGISYNPRATVNGFVKDGKLDNVKVSGDVCSLLMTELDNIPPCLQVFVEIKYQDGKTNRIKFFGS